MLDKHSWSMQHARKALDDPHVAGEEQVTAVPIPPLSAGWMLDEKLGDAHLRAIHKC